MEETTTTIPFLFLLMIHFLYIIIISKFYPIVDKFHLKNVPFLYYVLIYSSNIPCNKGLIKEETTTKKTEFQPLVDVKDVRINRDEVMLAIEIIGQPTTKNGEQLNDQMGYEEFSALFQESEPSLDEVKEAFSVYDQNRDGLVDARDLQRVLHYLGLREDANLEACEKMIKQHDRNEDGYVDLIDFSRLLEMSLHEKGK